MNATYDDSTIDALYDAWANGLDYVEIDGTMFVCYKEGIFTVKTDTICMDEDAKINLVLKPSKPWGYAAE